MNLDKLKQDIKQGNLDIGEYDSELVSFVPINNSCFFSLCLSCSSGCSKAECSNSSCSNACLKGCTNCTGSCSNGSCANSACSFCTIMAVL